MTDPTPREREVTTKRRVYPEGFHADYRGMATCTFDSCPLPQKARGLCNTHYARWQRNGHLRRLDIRPAAERFWEKVDKAGPVVVDGLGPCWLWTGALASHGYGSFSMDGRSTTATRAAWVLERGPIPPGMYACHRCDNPPCVRPDHLFLGTQRHNVRDMIDKGRARRGVLQGSQSPRAVLTADQVRYVRTAAGRSWTELGRELGVSRSTVRLAALGITWRSVA